VDERSRAILDFWFAGARADPAAAATRIERWFGGDAGFDEELRAHFAEAAARAARGELDGWRAEPLASLALVLLLDQLPRSLYRGTARAFAQDAAALAVCTEGIRAYRDRRLGPLERAFFYMPLQHAEDRAAQQRSLGKLERLVAEAPPAWRDLLAGFRDHAAAHREVILRFGRFPHRNALLGRASTDEELAFLAAGGPDWGQAAPPA
jgi:uncharacterized protein (DUF924 family)